MGPSDLNHEKGFSLVESVIACGVLAAGVLSVVQLFALAAAMSVTSRQTTGAAILAVQKLEELRAADAPVSGDDRIDRSGASAGHEGGGNPIAYRRRWTVTAAGAGLMALSVDVVPYRRGMRDAQDDPAGVDVVRLTTLRAGGMP
jgi:Tfp pilus assembly protein PilV